MWSEATSKVGVVMAMAVGAWVACVLLLLVAMRVAAWWDRWRAARRTARRRRALYRARRYEVP